MSEHWSIYADWNLWHGCAKANIDYKIGGYLVPEKVKFEWKKSDYHD